MSSTTTSPSRVAPILGVRRLVQGVVDSPMLRDAEVGGPASAMPATSYRRCVPPTSRGHRRAPRRRRCERPPLRHRGGGDLPVASANAPSVSRPTGRTSVSAEQQGGCRSAAAARPRRRRAAPGGRPAAMALGTGQFEQSQAAARHGHVRARGQSGKESSHSPLALADVTRLMACRRPGSIATAVRSGWTPLSTRPARRSRAGSRRSRGERAGEDPRDGHGLRLAGPAVRVADRPDRAVRREPAARHDERGGRRRPAAWGGSPTRRSRARERRDGGARDMPGRSSA